MLCSTKKDVNKSSALVTASDRSGDTKGEIDGCAAAAVAMFLCSQVLLNVVAPAVSDIEVAAANRAKRVRISCSRFRNAFKFPDIIRFVFLLIFRPFDLTNCFVFRSRW